MDELWVDSLYGEPKKNPFRAHREYRRQVSFIHEKPMKNPDMDLLEKCKKKIGRVMALERKSDSIRNLRNCAKLYRLIALKFKESDKQSRFCEDRALLCEKRIQMRVIDLNAEYD